jgi:hypothetical protein
MLKTHLRSTDQPKVAIKVEYQENKPYAVQAQVLRHMGLLEHFAANAAERYAWPNRSRSRRAHAERRMPGGKPGA